ncbi:MAG: hypothetical protein LBV80_07360 [Deltaproteobacteria bacterium]|jgi:hypothetical protein|nr:hypothetical protein [Deltaproteobacteria bacterium]
MEKDLSPIRIRYEYEQDPGTRVRYAHGVWGGINPQGEVELNFYTESDKLPGHSEAILSPDGTLGHEIVPHDESLKLVSRHIHSRIILNVHTARAVLEWLEDKVNILEDESNDARLFYGESGLEQ